MAGELGSAFTGKNCAGQVLFGVSVQCTPTVFFALETKQLGVWASVFFLHVFAFFPSPLLPFWELEDSVLLYAKANSRDPSAADGRRARGAPGMQAAACLAVPPSASSRFSCRDFMEKRQADVSLRRVR